MSVFSLAFPTAATWIKGLARPEQVGTGSVLIFVLVSAVRLAINTGFPLYTVPLAYACSAAAYTVGIHNGWLFTPQGNFWLANTFPAFMLVLVLLGGRYVWAKIKPRRRSRRKPPTAAAEKTK